MEDERKALGMLWRSVNREIGERFRHAFRGSELHMGAIMMLRQLKEKPGITVSELARRSGMVKSHISKMIEQLCRQGYLEKRPDPDDQRLLHVHLAPAGESLVADGEARAAKVWAEVMRAVPEAQLPEVTRGLQILLTALEQSRSEAEKE
ncbi:MAG: MarR family winged helix-turn-helix transcriptional regulator [Mycobacterium leprae]